jgi:hypothetical protein
MVASFGASNGANNVPGAIEDQAQLLIRWPILDKISQPISIEVLLRDEVNRHK